MLIAAMLVGGCTAATKSAGDSHHTLTVFAAASLTDAFGEIGSAFEAENRDTQVSLSFGNSQTLQTQIESGAPVDIFASADAKEMDALVAGGIVAPDAPRIFLTNRLVVIVPPSNPADVRQLQDLSRAGLKLVLAAPEVPVGNYARQSLELMNASFGPDFSRRVLANVVSSEDSVKPVVTKVQLDEADAGIVYISDAVAAPDLKTIEIPAAMNVTARYPISVLMNSHEPELAGRFVDMVLSDAGQSILRKWGFEPVQ
jgi:molybdate transport system substrate-binding protein